PRAAGAYSRPSLVAVYTAYGRRDTISLRMRLPTWNFTVVSEMNSSAPIARFDNPRASSRSTSSSRSVRPSRPGTSPDSDRTIADALWASNALSPRETARIARTGSVVSTSLTTYPRAPACTDFHHQSVLGEGA